MTPGAGSVPTSLWYEAAEGVLAACPAPALAGLLLRLYRTRIVPSRMTTTARITTSSILVLLPKAASTEVRCVPTNRTVSPRSQKNGDIPGCSRRDAGWAGGLRDEVLRRGVRADDGVGGLFRLQLGILAHLDADAVRAEELDDLGVVGQIGAGRVAPRVAAAPVLLAKQPGQGGSVLVGEAQLLSDSPVPVLGQRLGHLHPETVQEQVVLVLVVGEQLGGLLGDPAAHRDQLEAGPVPLPGGLRAEEVGDAQPRLLGLPGEGEPHDLAVPALVLVDDQVVTLRVGREVAPQ